MIWSYSFNWDEELLPLKMDFVKTLLNYWSVVRHKDGSEKLFLKLSELIQGFMIHAHVTLKLLISTLVPRGGGPLVISNKFWLICWLILTPRPSMHFLHKTFPGTTDETYHCAKFHSSIRLISWLPKTDLWETTGCSYPLVKVPVASINISKNYRSVCISS